jgi:hypothetical protein
MSVGALTESRLVSKHDWESRELREGRPILLRDELVPGSHVLFGEK